MANKIRSASYYTSGWWKPPTYWQIHQFTFVPFVGGLLGWLLGLYTSYLDNPTGGFFKPHIIFGLRPIIYFAIGFFGGLVLSVVLFALSFPFLRARKRRENEKLKQRIAGNPVMADVILKCHTHNIRSVIVEKHRVRMYPALVDPLYCSSDKIELRAYSIDNLDSNARNYKKKDHWAAYDHAPCLELRFRDWGFDALDDDSMLAFTEVLFDNLDSCGIARHWVETYYCSGGGFTPNGTFTYNATTGKGHIGGTYSSMSRNSKCIYFDYFLYPLEEYARYQQKEKERQKQNQLQKW